MVASTEGPCYGRRVVILSTTYKERSAHLGELLSWFISANVKFAIWICSETLLL